MASFRDTLDACGLWMLPYKGYKFTWDNGWEGDGNVQELLDRFFMNDQSREFFPNVLCCHLPNSVSYHQGILLLLDGNPVSKIKIGRRLRRLVMRKSCTPNGTLLTRVLLLQRIFCVNYLFVLIS